jgi:hypothetical protein
MTSEGFRLLNYAGLAPAQQWLAVQTSIWTQFLAVVVVLGVFTLFNLTVFPWASRADLRKWLQAMWSHQLVVLLESDGVFAAVSRLHGALPGSAPAAAGAIAVQELQQQREQAQGGLAELERLAQAIQVLRAAMDAARASLFPTMLEARFLLSGAGHEYRRNFISSRPCVKTLLMLGRRSLAYAKAAALDAEQDEDEEQVQGLAPRVSAPASAALGEVVAACAALTHQLRQAVKPLAAVLVDPLAADGAIRAEQAAALDELLREALTTRVERVEAAVTGWLALPGAGGEALLAYVITHARLLVTLASQYEDAYQDKRGWAAEKRELGWTHRLSDLRFTATSMSEKTLVRYWRGPLVGYDASTHMWYQRVFRTIDFIVHRDSFKNGFKGAVIASVLMLFSLMPSTQAYFYATSMSQAFTSSFSVLRRQRTGWMFDRAKERVLGVAAGYVIAGVVAEIFCAAGNCDPLVGWAYFIVGLPLLAVHVVNKARNGPMGPRSYAIYVLMKDYYTMTLIIITGPDGTRSAAVVWTSGGYLLLNTVIGCAVTLFVAHVIWPLTASGLVRGILARALQMYVFLVDAGIARVSRGQRLAQIAPIDLVVQDDGPAGARPAVPPQQHPHPHQQAHKSEPVAREAPGPRNEARRLTVRTARELDIRTTEVENLVSRELHIEAPPLVASLKAEPVHLRQAVRFVTFERALRATQAISSILWCINHAVRDPVAQLGLPKDDLFALQFNYVRTAYLRSVNSSLVGVSYSLRGTAYMSDTYFLLGHTIVIPGVVDKHLDLAQARAACFKPRDVGPNGAVLFQEFLLFRALLKELAAELHNLYELLEEIMISPPFAGEVSTFAQSATIDYWTLAPGFTAPYAEPLQERAKTM